MNLYERLVHHIDEALKNDAKIAELAPTNDYPPRLVHARQYHATMANAFANIITIVVLGEDSPLADRIRNEFERQEDKGTNGSEADGSSHKQPSESSD